MNTLKFVIKTLAKKWVLLITVPLAAALVVYFIMSQQPKQYKSSSTIYTGIVSGYDVLASESSRSDWMAVNNAIDNLINVITAESTLKNVFLKLLARNASHLDGEDRAEYLTDHSAEELRTLIPADVWDLVVPGDEDATFKNFRECYDSSRDNWFKMMFLWNHRHYSFKALSNIIVTRIGSSDMLRMSYTCDDQYIAYNILMILEVEFIEQYLAIRYQQTNDVVSYFERELKNIGSELKNKEDGLTDYNIRMGVINYQEQTKMVAERSKDLDASIEAVTRERDGAQEMINILEGKLEGTTQLYTNNVSFINQLHTINDLYTRMNRDTSDVINRELETKINEETDKLKSISKDISSAQYTKEGISNDAMIGEWLNALLIRARADVELGILLKCKKELNEDVKRFSPIGSSLKRQERDINFSEKNYLANLQSLNEAKLRQKNLQLTSATFKVLTPPTVALYPEKTKTKLFAVIAFLFVFVLICSIVIIMEEFNSKPYDKVVAQRIIDLPIMGAFPEIKEKSRDNEISVSLAKRHLGNTIMNYFNRNQTVNIINVFSADKGEGKSTVSEMLYEYFKELDTKPVLVNWEKDFDSTSKYFMLANSIYDFCVNENNMEAMPEANVIIVEYPSLKQASFPTKVLNTSAINILVTDSQKNWTGMSSLMINELKRFNTLCNIAAVLNRSDIDTVGSFTGMLPPFNKLHKIRFGFWNLGSNDKA